MLFLKIALAAALPAAASAGTVTCVFTIDNHDTSFWVNNADGTSLNILPDSSDPCVSSWGNACTVTFDDTTADGPQTIAISGFNDENFAPGQYCGRSGAGLAYICGSDVPGSAWNNVASSLTNTELETFSTDKLEDTLDNVNWYDPVNYPLSAGAVDFDDGIAVAQSGFSCTACNTFAASAGRPNPDEIWPASCNHYGYFRQSATCDPLDSCPLNCVGEWSEWSTCDATCGSAVSTREFVVTQESANDGDSCLEKYGVEADASESRTCELPSCAVDCEGAWGAWSGCDATCGEASQTRTFVVVQDSANGGATCATVYGVSGGDLDTASCGLDACPVDCEGAWGTWDVCDATCGEAIQARTFEVSREASNGGATCNTVYGVAPGDIDTTGCGLDACPVDCDGAWAEWCSCSSSCGGNGIQGRVFVVDSEAQNGGAACPTEVDERTCNTDIPCPVDCFGEWSAWSDCSVSCGLGALTRTFTVLRAAQDGGESCSSLFGGEGAEVDMKECNHLCDDNDDDDDDDDDKDDDDDVDRGHGYYPFAPFVTTPVVDGVFGVFGHYSNTNNTYLIASVDIALEELDEYGNPIDRHSIDTFASEQFSVTVDESSNFSGVPAVQISLEATVVDADGVSFGQVGIAVYVFTSFGNATSPSGAETWWVGPGDTKFTVEVHRWDFCDNGDTMCCVVDGDGASLRLDVTVTPGHANPADGVLLNRARRQLRHRSNDDDDDDDANRGCVEASSTDSVSRRSLRAIKASLGMQTVRMKNSVWSAVRQLKGDSDDDKGDDDDSAEPSNDDSDDDDDDSAEPSNDDSDDDDKRSGDDDDDKGSGDDDDKDDDDDNNEAHCFVFSEDSDLVLSTQVLVDGEFIDVRPTTVQTFNNATTVSVTFPKFSGIAAYDPIISAFQVDETVQVPVAASPAAASPDATTSAGMSGGAAAGVAIVVLLIVGVGVAAVIVGVRRRQTHRHEATVVQKFSHRPSVSTTSGIYETTDSSYQSL